MNQHLLLVGYGFSTIFWSMCDRCILFRVGKISDIFQLHTDRSSKLVFS